MVARYTHSPKYKQARDYFKYVLSLDRRISSIEAEIERQQSRLALNGVEGGEHVSKTMEGDALERGFVKLYDYCDSLDTRLMGYVDERDYAFSLLDHLPDGEMIVVMSLRYFEGVKFPAIHKLLVLDTKKGGYGMPMSERKMYSLHEQAMYRLWHHIPTEYRQRKSVQ